MHRGLITGFGFLLAILAACSYANQVVGITSAGGVSFVGTDATSVTVITWTNDGHGQLTGSMQYVNKNPDYIQGGATQPLTSGNSSFTGNVTNGSISLHIELGSTLNGAISGEVLTMQMPQSGGMLEPYTFHVGATSDYNKAVHDLSNQVENDRNSAVAQARASQDQTSLARDFAALKGDETTLDRDLQRLSSDEQNVFITQKQADAAIAAAGGAIAKNDCWHTGVAVSAFKMAVHQLKQDAQAVASNLVQVHQDHAQLSSDEAAVVRDGGQIPVEISSWNDRFPESASGAAMDAEAVVTQAQQIATSAAQHGQQESNC